MDCAVATHKQGKTDTDRCDEGRLVLLSGKKENGQHEANMSEARIIEVETWGTYREVKNISMNKPWGMEVPPPSSVRTFLSININMPGSHVV